MTIIKKSESVITGMVLIAFIGLACNRQIASTEEPLKPSDGKIMLSEAQIQLANIKVGEVGQGDFGTDLVLTGSLKVNEQSSVSISSRSDGRIEKLFFKSVGETVNPGDSLYSFYADELVATEREYFNLQRNNWNTSGQYPPSLLLENKLLFLGMIPAQIDQLKKDGKILFTITIISQVKGVIRSLKATEGQFVKAGEPLFELADNQTLWVETFAYPGDIKFLNLGMEAKVIIPSDRDREINTRISYINPSFVPGKNVLLIRSVINNSDKKLFPGMLANLKVETKRSNGMVIPASAIVTEKNDSKVWVQDENGAFFCKTIITGIQSSDSVMVLSGLEPSDKVVTSGVYLLNSEMLLKKGNIN
jgi:Cu(I)/Ag(I) efflux system membrane fusion protein